MSKEVRGIWQTLSESRPSVGPVNAAPPDSLRECWRHRIDVDPKGTDVGTSKSNLTA